MTVRFCKVDSEGRVTVAFLPSRNTFMFLKAARNAHSGTSTDRSCMSLKSQCTTSSRLHDLPQASTIEVTSHGFDWMMRQIRTRSQDANHAIQQSVVASPVYKLRNSSRISSSTLLCYSEVSVISKLKRLGGERPSEVKSNVKVLGVCVAVVHRFQSFDGQCEIEDHSPYFNGKVEPRAAPQWHETTRSFAAPRVEILATFPRKRIAPMARAACGVLHILLGGLGVDHRTKEREEMELEGDANNNCRWTVLFLALPTATAMPDHVLDALGDSNGAAEIEMELE
ncbi:hypothetical protein BD410DRAFT_805195 [Rickenella mellea]|uniref:Uncharacterized protein n=1 Tax=Rickenella mellea TaxID=50990 RepID=A0A4Y7PYQ9_9AGAM|nr:hypothetical protein BD410DRAFT_805195 [Rickenella mellea]